MTQYRMTFSPLRPGGSDGDPETVAEGDWETVRGAWGSCGQRLGAYGESLDPTRYPTYGKAAEGGRAYALHIIGQGTLAIWRDDEPRTIDLRAVAEAVTAQGVPAVVEHSGGGCQTIYAGTPDDEGRYAALAGPGWMENGRPVAAYGDLYIGPDDDGESDPYLVEEGSTEGVPEIAARIVSVARGTRA